MDINNLTEGIQDKYNMTGIDNEVIRNLKERKAKEKTFINVIPVFFEVMAFTFLLNKETYPQMITHIEPKYMTIILIFAPVKAIIPTPTQQKGKRTHGSPR